MTHIPQMHSAADLGAYVRGVRPDLDVTDGECRDAMHALGETRYERLTPDVIDRMIDACGMTCGALMDEIAARDHGLAGLAPGSETLLWTAFFGDVGVTACTDPDAIVPPATVVYWRAEYDRAEREAED